MLKVLFQDENFVAVYKPAGYLVHRTRISDGTDFVLQTLRDQLGQRVYPVHRLDRAACGVLVMGLSSEAASALAAAWRESQVRKTYWLVVRGWISAPGRIDRELRRERDGNLQGALTEYEPLEQVSLPFSVGPYAHSRYSRVAAMPATGRMHQLRRHFAGEGHPVLGDYKHGDYRHNKSIENHLSIKRLHLFARSLSFVHPFTGNDVLIEADPDAELQECWQKMGFSEE